MKETTSVLEKFSPYGGELILEDVSGLTSGNLNPENNVDTKQGNDRNMYSYVPISGCPHAKQTQVLMVLRNSSSKQSAEELMNDLKLKELAEDRHFVLLFPNPSESGWNYNQDKDKEDDKAFLVRCFASLPKGKGKVAGFNGMIFYIGTDLESNAMISTLAIVSPFDAAAIMIGEYPNDYNMPTYKDAEQVAWLYKTNGIAEKWLSSVNGNTKQEGNTYYNVDNNNVKYTITDNGLNANEVLDAWENMFSNTRRWRNDTYGTYQARVNFTELGFIKHVNDTSLNLNDGVERTWYEYIPEKVRNTNEKVPLVFYFHGINCTPLYGVEQSNWLNIAEKEGLIVVYPKPAIEERWNVWDDPRIPSDVSFVMALIKHMQDVHPIDTSRIYISGFSMGSMFSNALACAYPDVFAGVVACNGPNQGYLLTLDESVPGLKFYRPNTITANLPKSELTISPLKILADEKRSKYEYRMPFVQFAGLLDGVGFNKDKIFPFKSDDDGMWIDTIKQWKKFNAIDGSMEYVDTKCGLKASSVEEKGRYEISSWDNVENKKYYYFIVVDRMPHAVDLSEFDIGWNIIKHYRRNEDGSLGEVDNV